MTLTDTFTLANGEKIPQVGFGTWQSKDGEEAYTAVRAALEAGYVHIDTAAVYGNEESVGRAIKDSGVPREKLFITTKLWAVGTTEEAEAALDESLRRLDLDYVNLYLIHWPNPKAFRPDFAKRNAAVWKGMEAGVRAGKTRSIGISNFRPHHMDPLLEVAEIAPAVNQIYINPTDQQEEVVAYNQAHHILTEAYSPLGTGKIFQIKELADIAARYKKTIAQLAIRWSLDKGYLPLPKSITPDRVRENAQVFDFKLSAEDIAFIDGLRGKTGFANDPDKVDF